LIKNKIDKSLKERRKKMSEIRNKFKSQTIENPFSLSFQLSSEETISDFVTENALLLHKKRKNMK
jgi:hypothetical protein